jgi:hypothetical protein
MSKLLQSISISLLKPLVSPGLHRNALLCQACLRIHIVVLSIVIIYGRRWRLLLFEKLFPIERACRVELEPGPYAVQIKVMVLVAR